MKTNHLAYFLLIITLAIISGCRLKSNRNITKVEKSTEVEESINSNQDEKDNHSEFSKLENEVVLEINKCRSNPPQYAKDVLEPFLKDVRKGKYTFNLQEGDAVIEEAIYELERTEPMGILEPTTLLHKFAKDHCIKQGKTGKIGHNQDNLSFEMRAKQFGLNNCGENISYGYDKARMIVVSLIVDDGVSSRGHRKNILNYSYNQIGVACGPHKTYHHMCVIDFNIK